MIPWPHPKPAAAFINQPWHGPIRWEINAHLINHPELAVQPWFEALVTKWGLHPMAAEASMPLSLPS